MSTFGYRQPQRPSPIPLVLAGCALLLAGWAAADRMGWFRPAPLVEPRAVTPRGDLADYELDLIRIFEENAASVVHITTEKIVTDWRGYRSKTSDGTGSGFVWDQAGVIVTNAHVVEGHQTVRVALGDEVIEADVIGRATNYDIAVLRLRQMPSTLRPIPLGSSGDLKVGQTAIAIGNPFGLDQTLTSGIISQLERTIRTEKAQLQGVIQVDAAINPGNSGGPLLDSAGRLIGMNTAIYSPSGASAGIGFAVPVDTINLVVPYLLDAQNVRRDLGISGEPIRFGGTYARQLGQTSAVQIREFVGPGAREANLEVYDEERRQGDIILAVDGLRVGSMRDIFQALKDNVRGEKVRVDFIRIRRGRIADRLKTEVELFDAES